MRLFGLVLALLTVLWLSLSPTPLPTPWIQEHFVPWDHAILYATLTLVGLYGFRDRVVPVLVGALAIGAGLEIVQMLLPVRAFQWSDLAANALGVGAGFGLFLLARKLRRRMCHRGPVSKA